MKRTPQILYLNLDVQELPLGGAIEIASEDKLGLQRALALNKLIQSAARSDNQSVLECATEILNRLASMD